MKEYIVLNKELTGLPVNIYIPKDKLLLRGLICSTLKSRLPVNIYIPKDKTPHIMFQNDYEDTPNPNNLIRMDLDGNIVETEE